MINLLMIHLFGTMYCYAMTVFSLRVLFLIRALILIWFDVDVSQWMRNKSDRVKAFLNGLKINLGN